MDSQKSYQRIDINFPPWLSIAFRELGQSEISGDGSNPRIVEFLNSVNLPLPDKNDDETPWCSAFVNWCIEKSEIMGTKSAMARSWVNWANHIGVPAFGCVTVLSSGQDRRFGHVGFFVGFEDKDKIKLLGGNQSNSVSVCCFEKNRVIAHRWP